MRFDPAIRERIVTGMGKVWPDGARKDNAVKDTRAIVQAAVDFISENLEDRASLVHVALEMDEAQKITGFIVFDGKRRTEVVPIALSNGIVRIRGNVIFVGHSGGRRTIARRHDL